MRTSRRLARALLAPLLALAAATATVLPADATHDALEVTTTGACTLARGMDNLAAYDVTNHGTEPLRDVVLDVGPLPTGITATVTPASATIPADWTVTFRVTYAVAADAPAGTHPITVTATSGAESAGLADALVIVDRSVPPTGVVATPAAGSAVVTWAAPVLVHPDSEVQSSRVTASPGGAVAEVRGTATEAVVHGLTPGTSYTFTVSVLTPWGRSDASTASAPVVPLALDQPAVPAGAPGAFTGTVDVDAGDESVWVDVADTAAGETSVTGYDVEVNGVAGTAITRLTAAGEEWSQGEPREAVNGSSTVVRVRRVNASGAGPWSAPSTAVVPAGVPYAPYLRVVSGDGAAFVCLYNLGDNGSPLTSFDITDQNEGSWSFPGDAQAGWITGLTNDGFYQLSVAGTNAAGTGEAYEAVEHVVPSGPPANAVTGLAAQRGDGSVTLSWDAQAGAYEIAASGHPSVVLTSSETGATFAGLTNGTAYTFTVRRLSAVGPGPAATTGAVTPAGVPGAVSQLTATPDPETPGNVLVSWQAAAANGSSILGYAVTADPGDAATETTGTSVSLPTGDGTFTISVAARNDVGTGSGVTSAPVTVDTTAPALTVTAPPAVTLTGKAGVTYGAGDAASYDVRYRVARYDTLFGAYRYPAAWQATTATKAEVGALRGWTYCFSVRARDAAGNTGAWSADKCTAAPLDDRSLTASAGWSRGTSGAYYGGTYTATVTRGATLTRTNVRARRLALVATRCAACGSVGVYLDGRLVKTIRLYAATTKYRQVVSVDLGRIRAGTVTLKALSGRAYVDGLAASRV